jgi:hypothetical protein
MVSYANNLDRYRYQIGFIATHKGNGMLPGCLSIMVANLKSYSYQPSTKWGMIEDTSKKQQSPCMPLVAKELN